MRLILLLAMTGFAAPNVLFLSVDDMNDWVGCLGHPQARTPHLDRLAERGVLFTNAHCVVPVCNPSRVATLTGLRPEKTGVHENNHRMRSKLQDLVTLPQYFRSQGYHVLGGGKIFHDVPPHCHDPESWDDYFWWNEHGPKGGRGGGGWRSPYSIPPDPEPKDRPTRKITSLTKRNFDWGSVDLPDSAWPDRQAADWAAEFLAQPQDKPFFLAVGIFRPHVPWFNPPRFADQYPLADIALPPVKADDTDDLGPWARKRALDRNSKHDKVLEFGEWRSAVQAYLASISHADANLGRVLDALDASPHRDKTLIVLWSDHGYHLGEKGHWHKRTLWERATRVPLIIAGPGITPARCEQPVSLLDLYPTLLELCQLPTRQLDGRSLTPLLRSPQTAWPHPAVTSYLGNHAVRDQRWRYIHYTDGSEELYDHQSDPNEWTNLASRPEHAATIARLRQALPTRWAADFNALPTGPITDGQTGSIAVVAEAGHAEINAQHSHDGGKSLRIVGGADRQVELRLPLQKGQELSLWAERWTANKPYRCRIQAWNGRAWQEVCNADHVAIGGFHTHLRFAMPFASERLRLLCTAPSGGGVMIDSLEVHPAPTPIKPFLLASPPKWLAVTVERPDHAFVAHPEHELPATMLVQDSRLKLRADASRAGLDPETATWRFDLRKTQGSSALMNPQNWVKHAPSRENTLHVDQYGEHIVEIAGQDAKGAKVSHRYRAFCHMSRSVVASGRTEQIPGTADLMQRSTVNGIVRNGVLVERGFRFFPTADNLIDDPSPEPHGYYMTKEPRIFEDSRGVLHCGYHVNVTGIRTDAPQGMGVVITSSYDGGQTWQDSAFYRHAHGVIGYVAFVEHQGQVQMYFTGGHSSQPRARALVGVYRVTSEDSKNWSAPEAIDGMTTLLAGAPKTLGRDISVNQNGLRIENMSWKGQTGTALLIPFYIGVRILISMDGGETWDVFFNAREAKVEMDEICIDLLADRRIYLLSRTRGPHKLEYYLGLQGQIVANHGGARRNHLGTSCHHGVDVMDDGRVLVSSTAQHRGRMGATIAIGDPQADGFDTRTFFVGGGWGYSDVTWLADAHAILMVGECEPIRPNTGRFMGLNPKSYFPGDDKERYSITSFTFSEAYFNTLPKHRPAE